MKKKAVWFAVGRMVLALCVAAALMVTTGFGIRYLRQGPQAVENGTELIGKSYISADLTHILSLCGEEVNNAGETVAYYAVAPIGDRFVMLRFDAQQKNDIQALYDATVAYLSGEESVMRVHMPVKGMVVPAKSPVYDLLNQWFENNKDWMSRMGIAGEDPLPEHYLSALLVEVDKAGNLSEEWTVILSALAGLMVLYALVELIFLVFSGKKDKTETARPAKEKKEKKVKADKRPAAVPTEAVTEASAEESAEEAGETAEEADA